MTGKIISLHSVWIVNQKPNIFFGLSNTSNDNFPECCKEFFWLLLTRGIWIFNHSELLNFDENINFFVQKLLGWFLVVSNVRENDVPEELKEHDERHLVKDWNTPEVNQHRNRPYHPIYYHRLPNLIFAVFKSLLQALFWKVIH